MPFSCWSLFHCSQAKKCSTSRTAFGFFERSRLFFWDALVEEDAADLLSNAVGRGRLPLCHIDTVTMLFVRLEDALKSHLRSLCISRDESMSSLRCQKISSDSTKDLLKAGMHLYQGVEWFINLQLSWGQWSYWGTRSGHRLRDFRNRGTVGGYDSWHLPSQYLSSFKLHFS